MHHAAIGVSLVLLAGPPAAPRSIPPLDPGRRARLETARDGRDHREEAFTALVEHVEGWGHRIGDAAIRLEPDLDAMVSDPDSYRGDLCLLRGAVQQQTALDAGFGDVAEWFIRDDAGRPFIVYVVGAAAGPTLPDGRRVRIPARFYKPIDLTARDGQSRRYAAFVGSAPVLEVREEWGRLWIVAIPVAAMLLVFAALMLTVRRRDGNARRAPRGQAEVDDARPLPDDPAEALAELQRRAAEPD